MRLHTAPTPNGTKPLIALEELGVPYELHWVDLRKGDQKQESYLALNPNGKIPTLEDGALKVWESGAILLYLAEKFGALLPKSEAGRIEAIQYAFFQVGGIGPNAGRLFGEWRKPAEERTAYFEVFRDEVNRIVGVLDRVLADGRPYLATEYSIGDIMHFHWVRGLLHAKVDGLAEPPAVRAWIDRIEARPAVARAMALKPTI